MTEPSISELFGALEDTWPPEATDLVDGWKLRSGAGGGQRVSAATWEHADFDGNIADLEAAQRAAGHAPLVMVRGDQPKLDAALQEAGYAARDETVVLMAPVSGIADADNGLADYPSWPPLATQCEMWLNMGVGEARRAVMNRVTTSKTALLGRRGDTPVATLFAAISGDMAMIHGLVVAPEARRTGVGTEMMRAANRWARKQGATWLTVLVVRENAAAVDLYEKLGLREVAKYHYRFRSDGAL